MYTHPFFPQQFLVRVDKDEIPRYFCWSSNLFLVGKFSIFTPLSFITQHSLSVIEIASVSKIMSSSTNNFNRQIK